MKWGQWNNSVVGDERTIEMFAFLPVTDPVSGTKYWLQKVRVVQVLHADPGDFLRQPFKVWVTKRVYDADRW